MRHWLLACGGVMAGSLGLVVMADGCDSKCDFGECSGPGDGAADSGGDTRIGVDSGHLDGTVGDTAMDGPGGDTGFSDGPLDSAPDTMDASRVSFFARPQ